MHLLRRDLIATASVAVAGAVYGLWAVGSALPGTESARVVGIVVLALGFLASASAVVPSFDELIHGNKTYLVVTSLMGAVALGCGIAVLVTAGEAALATLVAATGVLWFVSTVHHSLQAEHAPPALRTARPRVPRTAPGGSGLTPAARRYEKEVDDGRNSDAGTRHLLGAARHGP
jgi:hypothetical protein